jgi:hypothetical protein
VLGGLRKPCAGFVDVLEVKRHVAVGEDNMMQADLRDLLGELSDDFIEALRGAVSTSFLHCPIIAQHNSFDH